MDIKYESLTLHVVPLRSDNYSYVIHDEKSGQTLVFDPSETEPLIRFLKSKNYGLGLIIDTHHHDDHTEGNVGLQKEFGAKIVASAYDVEHERISGKVNQTLKDGDSLSFGAYRFRAMTTPGHTLGHVCLYLEGAHWLFSGDTLFALGCGRLFEGSASQMWTSMKKLRELPDDTLLFCGHEYTLSNARFALSIDASDRLKQHIDALEKRRTTEGKTIPTRLADEKEFNPFLRADAPLFAAMGSDDDSRFAAIRKAKDNFR